MSNLLVDEDDPVLVQRALTERHAPVPAPRGLA
jgi:hypothetical protein